MVARISPTTPSACFCSATEVSNSVWELIPCSLRPRIRSRFMCVNSSFASAAASCACSWRVSSCTRSCPASTLSPEPKAIFWTTPGRSALTMTPFTAATLPMAPRVPCHCSCFTITVVTASGGGRYPPCPIEVLMPRYFTKPTIPMNPATASNMMTIRFAIRTSLRPQRPPLSPRALQEGPQALAAGGMAELPERLALDLADALAGHGEGLADLFQGVLATVAYAEAHLEDHLLAGRESLQDLLRLLLQIELDDRVDRRRHRAVLDEIPEVGGFFLADRGLEGDRLLGDLQNLADLGDRDPHLLGDLLGRRLAADLLHQGARGPDQLVDRLDHVHRDADGARLVGDGAGDRLPDPPGGVGRELVAALVLELVHRLHQPDVSFLDQVEELQTAVGVLLGDRHDQTEVRLHQLGFGLGGHRLAGPDPVGGQLDFLGGGLHFPGDAGDLLLGRAHLVPEVATGLGIAGELQTPGVRADVVLEGLEAAR